MSHLNSVARSVFKTLSTNRLAASADKDAEWQRVNSYIADVLKDAHVLYAKLARLQGDFTGHELSELETISEGVLGIGGKLSTFSKAFNEGKAKMSESDIYGSDDVFGGEAPSPAPMPVPESPVPAGETPEASEGSGSQEDLDIEFDYAPESSESEASGSEKESD
jgi:hypothetical protein